MKSIFSFVHSFFENKVKPVKLYNENDKVAEEQKEDQHEPEEENVIKNSNSVKEDDDNISHELNVIPEKEEKEEFSGEDLFEQVKIQSMETIVTNCAALEKILDEYDGKDPVEEEKCYFQKIDERPYTDYLKEDESEDEDKTKFKYN